LDSIHAVFARGEIVLVRGLLGKGPKKVISKEQVEIFFGEERLPEGWSETVSAQGVFGVVRGISEVAKLVAGAKPSE
jgi:hypothetical protein